MRTNSHKLTRVSNPQNKRSWVGKLDLSAEVITDSSDWVDFLSQKRAKRLEKASEIRNYFVSFATISERPNLWLTPFFMTPTPSALLRTAVLLCAASVTAHAKPLTEAEAVATWKNSVQPILSKYCYECHGDGAKKGQVSLDEFASDKEMLGKTSLWMAALKNVRAGMMPPPDEDARPSSEEIKKLESWIKFGPFGIDPEKPDPGRVTVRRLNRVEYHNTIRDLMGIDFNSEVEFPPDDTGHGFDNLGEVLTISPMLLEKYLQASEEVVDKAVPRVARVPIKRSITPREFRREEAAPVAAVEGAAAPATPAAPAAGGGGNPAGRNDLNVRKGGKLAHTFTLKDAGVYKFEFKAEVRSTFDFDGGRATMTVKVDDEELNSREIFWDGKPVQVQVEKNWAAGPHKITVELSPLTPTETVAAAAPPPPPAVAEMPELPPLPGVLAAAGATPGAPGAAGATPGAAAVRNRPPVARSVDLRVSSVEILGPMDEKSWVPPDNYRRFFAEDVPAAPEARDAYARKVLQDFTERAFRRPVDAVKLDQLASVARATYTKPGKRFEDGIAQAMMGVLASPRFLFRLEDSVNSEAAERFAAVDEYALASRLSYFLWSSMPDQELFTLAKQGELRKQLPAQVARMLKDTKSQAFVKNFPGQWLQARDIETVEINARAVLGVGNARGNVASPVDLNGAIRKNMRSETEMYFDYVLREDRSVLEFIDSDYTFLNAKLATHYGVTGVTVTGDELRRVTLPPDSPRGGMLTQGTVLAVTSNPTRTSPVKRGLFLLENILGTPPPPPPPDIPALDEAAKAPDGRLLTQREALALHRANALCSSCHARMDPLGFAFENFNAMGNWRDTELKQPIEPAGKLATGEAFANIRELKHVLTHERRLDFYRCLTEKMLTYALGRTLDYYDVNTVDQIVARLEENGGKFSALLNGIIESTPFQKQRNLHAVQGTVSIPSDSPAAALAQASSPSHN